MAKESWIKKIANAVSKMVRGQPLGKQTSVPATEKARRAAARGHRAGEYHFGRVSTVKDEGGNFKAYRVGPVPDPSGATYRGARPATYEHVIRMVSKLPPGRIVVSVYGDLGISPNHVRQEGEPRFSYAAKPFDRDGLIKVLTADMQDGIPIEDSVQDIFDLVNRPELILSWEGRPAPLKEK